jgi:hypothetical protein
MDDPGCYLPQCYWLNENRRALPNSYCAYHEFVGKVDTGHGSYGLLYDVNNTINSTQFSRALALSDALAGNYSLFDPTFTSAGLVYDNSASGTLVSTVTKGLLPEATLSLTGTGSSNFSVAWATDSNGSKVAQVKTAVSNVTAGTYSLSLVQTYTNPVTGLQTKTTAFSATITVYAWTPDQSATPLMAWFTPSTSSCFTDALGTVPVVNDGDLVACIKSHSGAVICNQVSGTKPAYRTGGGKPYLDFASGSLFSGVTILTDGSGQHSGGVAAYFTANGANQSVMDYAGGTGLGHPLINNAGTAKTTAAASPSSVSDNGPSISINTAVVLSELTSTTSTEVFVNGTGNGATNLSPNTLNFNTNSEIFLGNGSTVKVFGFAMYKGVISGADHTKLVTYLSGLQ